MVASSTTTGSGGARWLGLTLLLAAVGLAGCQGGFGHDFVMHYKRKFDRRDPIAILDDKNSSGEDRAHAISRIQEPLAHGGSQDEQVKIIAILGYLAKDDKEPLCRLQAIRTLGRFKDRSVAEPLQKAYYAANPANKFDGNKELTKNIKILGALFENSDLFEHARISTMGGNIFGLI